MINANLVQGLMLKKMSYFKNQTAVKKYWRKKKYGIDIKLPKRISRPSDTNK